jgi:hypothetical protein
MGPSSFIRKQDVGICSYVCRPQQTVCMSNHRQGKSCPIAVRVGVLINPHVRWCGAPHSSASPPPPDTSAAGASVTIYIPYRYCHLPYRYCHLKVIFHIDTFIIASFHIDTVILSSCRQGDRSHLVTLEGAHDRPPSRSS